MNSIRGVAACLLALPGTAHAGPGKGALGPESRATVAISISVMPRFRPSTEGGTAGLSSNAPRLRYEVVKQPMTDRQLAAEAARRAPAAPVLLVVSPD